MYIVLSMFDDLQDMKVIGGVRTYHRYRPGDVYPREGYSPTTARIQELLYGENRLRKPLIAVAHKELIHLEKVTEPPTEGQIAEELKQAAKQVTRAAREATKAAREVKKAGTPKKPAPKKTAKAPAKPARKKAGS